MASDEQIASLIEFSRQLKDCILDEGEISGGEWEYLDPIEQGDSLHSACKSVEQFYGRRKLPGGPVRQAWQALLKSTREPKGTAEEAVNKAHVHACDLLQWAEDEIAQLELDETRSLTFREQCIVAAIGKRTLTGPEIAKSAGYNNNSRFRQTLSDLVKRKVLTRSADGYSVSPNVT